MKIISIIIRLTVMLVIITVALYVAVCVGTTFWFVLTLLLMFVIVPLTDDILKENLNRWLE